MGAGNGRNCDALAAMEGEGRAVRDGAEVEDREKGAAVPPIPSSDLTVDISLPFDQKKPRIMSAPRPFVNFPVGFHAISSNRSILAIPVVLKVSVREESGDDAILTVRLYGPNTDLVIDRKRELQVGFHNLGLR
ncbi:hypothetical protein B296_00011806 [Ensete ventricosum]|uniref:Uncharacterized protein n=1 Tax=Ensete ventricosum TaxID=4639 RepID=A0A427APB0_ENSVE|nr:hypothetical protein B296_00011806 [Ensete ventricosum]